MKKKILLLIFLVCSLLFIKVKAATVVLPRSDVNYKIKLTHPVKKYTEDEANLTEPTVETYNNSFDSNYSEILSISKEIYDGFDCTDCKVKLVYQTENDGNIIHYVYNTEIGNNYEMVDPMPDVTASLSVNYGIVILGDNVKLYDKPTIFGTQKATIAKGTIINNTSIMELTSSGPWIKVDTGTYKGWIYKNYSSYVDSIYYYKTIEYVNDAGEAYIIKTIEDVTSNGVTIPKNTHFSTWLSKGEEGPKYVAYNNVLVKLDKYAYGFETTFKNEANSQLIDASGNVLATIADVNQFHSENGYLWLSGDDRYIEVTYDNKTGWVKIGLESEETFETSDNSEISSISFLLTDRFIIPGVNDTESEETTDDVKYTLVYDSNGGSECDPSEKSVKAGQEWGSLCNPSYKGYKFNGWFTSKTGGNKITSNSKADKNIVVYAQWRANSTDTNAKTGVVAPILFLLVLGSISITTFIVVKNKSVNL